MARGVITGSVKPVDEPENSERKVHQRVLRASPVRDVQVPAAAQDAVSIGQRAQLSYSRVRPRRPAAGT